MTGVSFLNVNERRIIMRMLLLRYLLKWYRKKTTDVNIIDRIDKLLDPNHYAIDLFNRNDQGKILGMKK